MLGSPVTGELIWSGGEYGDVWSTDTHTLKMGCDDKGKITSSVEFSSKFASNPKFSKIVPKTIKLRHERTRELISPDQIKRGEKYDAVLMEKFGE